MANGSQVLYQSVHCLGITQCGAVLVSHEIDSRGMYVLVTLQYQKEFPPPSILHCQKVPLPSPRCNSSHHICVRVQALCTTGSECVRMQWLCVGAVQVHGCVVGGLLVSMPKALHASTLS